MNRGCAVPEESDPHDRERVCSMRRVCTVLREGSQCHESHIQYRETVCSTKRRDAVPRESHPH